MSELNYGVNVEILLYDLSQHESEDIGEFDFYSEDEGGREGAATIDITLLAADAVKLIAEIKAQRDALAAELWLTRHLIPDDVVTPHTTDTLNEIRAEGIEILTGKLQQLIDEGVFDAKEIGVAAGAVHEGAQIAAQLRAGEPS